MAVFDSLKKHLHLGQAWKRPNSQGCRPISLIFSQFRAVLKANNSALELMADMGEKLSGEYLFDRRYVQTTVEELIGAMYHSVQALNMLTVNRWISLGPILAGLEARVRAIATGRDDREGPPLLWLADVQSRDWPLVGGKAAHLSELLQYPEVRVPEGFVITTRLFHDLLDVNGLREDFDRFEALLADAQADEGVLEALRSTLKTRVQEAQPPPGLLDGVAAAVRRLKASAPPPLFLAVRSSAQEEDLDFSFAGQFRSVLQVPARPAAVFHAYLQVVSSLFGAKAVRYRRQVFPEGGPLSIAACCQRMVDAKASGIIYTDDPMSPGSRNMLVVGALGQGQAVVEGQLPTDFFRIAKGETPQLLDATIARKEEALVAAADQGGGLMTMRVAAEQTEQPCLGEHKLLELAGIASHLETFFKRPQDIEWTVDAADSLYILQARPLLLTEPDRERKPLSEKLEGYTVIAGDQGRVAQQGIGAGPACLVETLADLKAFPEGAVLVSHRDSSQFVQVMQRAAAIVTEVGTPVSHMSTLCREFKVPCLVGVPEIFGKVTPGEEITVDAEDRRIYRGRVVELLTYQAATAMNVQMAPEFRMLRHILRNVSRLHLVDPLMQDFRPEGCKTFHDMLRFIHETAVLTLVDIGRSERCLNEGRFARQLDLPVPAGILVIDIGGGLIPDAPVDLVPFAAIRSNPFRAILEGMLFPEVWHRAAMPVGFRDMMHSMLTVPQDALSGQYTGHNIAIISDTYVNLCFRFGYHFNIIDAFCHGVERDNHIYFRFLGGATDIAKRSRRATLIATILEAFDFSVQTKGDLVIARTSNLVQSEMERTLNILGRLIGFTRQLDVQMTDDRAVERYAEAFLMGDYGIVAREG